jgi:hypothetical protein
MKKADAVASAFSRNQAGLIQIQIAKSSSFLPEATAA